MAKVRQDAWSKENDLLLADTVLRHIREGSTQLRAFEEVGDKLNRTAAACGFRWNAILRDQYHQAIEIAKKQRKERKKLQQKQANTGRKRQTALYPQPVAKEGGSNITLDDVIAFLHGLNEEGQSSNETAHENERLQQECERLQNENEELRKRLTTLEKEHETVKEDYQSLIQIMDRARKMVVFGEEEQNNSAFRMDKNGNLEKIAK
ncbi:MAG TPA: RsfA family transcriptional regulator [Bacillales bacterium]|nr:RsfA family transcriptional regulator [Bacillales bacterium]